ncbi:MAG: bifunctional metallophosphatase/5'-nucleotidase [Methanoregula sp.]
MSTGSRSERLPIKLPVIAGLGILCVIILAVMLFWYLPGTAPAPHANATVHVKIVGVNDFHGYMPPGQVMNNRPVGSAPVLASYLTSAMAPGNADGIIFALPGDVIGNSPPQSSLLLDEPAMVFFNSFANGDCSVGSKSQSASCNVVATLGNNEFDYGLPELSRMINGGNGNTTIPHIVDPYPGSKLGYVSANVVRSSGNTTILPPYTVRNVGGVPVAFIGATTISTPGLQNPSDVEGLTFLDEADTINRYIPEIHRQGVHSIVVLLHEGGNQTPYDGPTRVNETVTGRVTQIIPRLDPGVDVVLSAHTHEFTNAYLNNNAGKPVLVTQADMWSRAYADIDLIIDKNTGEIVSKSARIVPAYADQPPGTRPEPAATALLLREESLYASAANQTIGVALWNITMEENPAGESAMGDMVADGARAAMKTDVGFDISTDIRAGLSAGNITWNNVYAVQPAGGTILSMTLTGEQIRSALEQQWQEPAPEGNLIVSGLAYTWNASQPAGSKVARVNVNGVPLNPKTTYTVSIESFLVSGGTGYTIFSGGQNITTGYDNTDTLVSYVQSLPQPVNVTVDGRVQRIGS